MPQIGLVNVDFKWKDGKPYLLELGDAIDSSGFQGYNVLYGQHRDDEVMLRKMVQALHERFTDVHLIVNSLQTDYWPYNQIHNVRYWDTVFDFFAFARKLKRRQARNHALLFGENSEKQQAPPRIGAELQVALQQLNIGVTVVNAAGMMSPADDKYIFNQLVREVPQTCLIGLNELTSKLAQVASEFPSDRIVLKPHRSTRGAGILILTKAELLEHADRFALFFSQRDAKECPPFEFLDAFRRLKAIELRHVLSKSRQTSFMLQAYIDSDPIEIEEEGYDPTGRAVLLLQHDETDISVEMIDGYWKLPERPLQEGVIEERALLSRKKSAKFTDEQRQAISTQFKSFTESFSHLFQTRVEFYVNTVRNIPGHAQVLLTNHFTDRCFDVVTPASFAKLSEVAQTHPAIAVPLLRTLLNDFGYAAWVKSEAKQPRYALLIQQALLAYLADKTSPIDFAYVDQLNQPEQAGLTNYLSCLNQFTSDQTVLRNAKRLLDFLKNRRPAPAAAGPSVEPCRFERQTRSRPPIAERGLFGADAASAVVTPPTAQAGRADTVNFSAK